jgi:hypothetical protein
MAKPDPAAEPADAPELSIDDILEAKQPSSETVTIVLDATADPPKTATIKVAAIGRIAWNDLLDEHQATDEQQSEFRQEQLERGLRPNQVQRRGWNPDTFPPVAIAACAVAPKISVAQAKKLWNDPRWNDGELDRLFSAVLLVNQSSKLVSLGKESEQMLAFARSLPSAG